MNNKVFKSRMIQINKINPRLSLLIIKHTWGSSCIVCGNPLGVVEVVVVVGLASTSG